MTSYDDVIDVVVVSIFDDLSCRFANFRDSFEIDIVVCCESRGCCLDGSCSFLGTVVPVFCDGEAAGLNVDNRVDRIDDALLNARRRQY